MYQTISYANEFIHDIPSQVYDDRRIFEYMSNIYGLGTTIIDHSPIMEVVELNPNQNLGNYFTSSHVASCAMVPQQIPQYDMMSSIYGVALSSPFNTYINNSSPLMISATEEPFCMQQEFHYLGIEEVDPEQYISQYGMELVSAEELPHEVYAFPTPIGHTLAVDSNPDELPLLVGDLHVLDLIDMFCAGLADYKLQFDMPLKFSNF